MHHRSSRLTLTATLLGTAWLGSGCTAILGDFSLETEATPDSGSVLLASWAHDSGGSEAGRGTDSGTKRSQADASPDTATNEASVVPACDAGTVPCGDQCVVEDDSHCGTSCSDCLGGLCGSGMCSSVEMAGSGSFPLSGANSGGFAIGGGRLFVGESGLLVSVEITKSGPGNLPVPVSGIQGRPSHLRMDGSTLYWMEAANTAGDGPYRIRRCEAPSCDVLTDLAVELDLDASPVDMAFDGANVYWVANYSSIFQCPKAGCGTTPTQLVSGQTMSGLATDGIRIFWADALAGEIRACALGAPCAAPEVVAVTPSPPLTIAEFGGRIYWLTRGEMDPYGSLVPGTASLWSCESNPCIAPVALAHNLHIGGALSVDGSGAYFQSDDFRIFQCALGGCDTGPRALMASESGAGQYLALGDDAVYFSQARASTMKGAGHIRRIAK